MNWALHLPRIILNTVGFILPMWSVHIAFNRLPNVFAMRPLCPRGFLALIYVL
jgi:hypothetical protein